MTSPTNPNVARINELNDTVRYAMWSVFKVGQRLPADVAERDRLGEEAEAYLEGLGQGPSAHTGVETVLGADVDVRGVYDVGGLRADADLMIWWHAPAIEQLQAAYRGFLRTGLGAHLEPVWSVAALHRPAEFNRSHLPAFLAGERVRDYLCVYPFVRSYDWYVIDGGERRSMLAEHGAMARPYPDVRANTIPAFALGDYEWILAFEADELHRIVDLMRELRASKARLHVREEIPFYTGPRVDIRELVAALP
ncbi:hydrogen peroxide-dependent heme synthase [Agilicoccus flavus]|uniref:hydrogen peroxide-dependent heme synthase n=1 Tax=Agilicoccus flavus TaxID=2775968 RepID=UPI001CF6CBEC|nr:hydrogen peroxide-dependent heme synthase [Agilicoccus flavus]